MTAPTARFLPSVGLWKWNSDAPSGHTARAAATISRAAAAASTGPSRSRS